MKLAPVLALKKKSRTKQRVEGLIRLFQGKKEQAKGTKTATTSKSTAPKAAGASMRPGPRSTRPPSKTPGFIDAQAALMGDAREPITLPAPTKKRRKPKKNPFLSTPVPDTFRPPAPIAPLPSVHPPPLPASSLHTATLAKPDVPKRFPAPAEPAHQVVRLASPKASPPIRESISSPRTTVRPPPTHLEPRSTFAPATVPRLATSTAPVRAVAVAHEKSNAVGTVELSCTAAGLLIQFVRISSYTEGYVPYPTTSSERVAVPYEQVARVDIDGDGLVHLTLDASCTPYSRLVLAGLARDPAFDHVTSHRRRARIERNVTLAALLAWIPVALILRAVAPDLSAVIVMGIAASSAAVLHMVRRDIASKVVLFNRSTEQVRDELLSELRLRLAPGRVRTHFVPSDVPVPKAAPAALGEPEAEEAGSLRGLFATAGIVAAAAAIAILVGKNLLFSAQEPEAQWGQDQSEAWAFLDREPAPASDPLASSSAASAIAPDPTPVIPPPPPCSCDRADSPLWSDGVPRMSVLAHNRPGPTSYDRPSMYPEIAVVNNSSEDLKDIVMVVDFLLGPRDGRKARVLDKQDLFWEGRLGPGKAVKWRVRGRGDEYSVTSFVSGMIGQEDAKPAPADTFYKLSMTANTPSVRLHGTKMLAYLGDERVGEGLEKLRQEGREEMVDTIEQIAIAARPLRVCSVRSKVDPKNAGQLVIKACVFNASPAEVTRPMVTARAKLSDAASEARWSLPEDLPSKTGVITTGTVAVPGAEDGDPRDAMVWVGAER